MAYYSMCTGSVLPAYSLEELIEALKEEGFYIGDIGNSHSLIAPGGGHTGFDVDRATGRLVGDGGLSIASGFDVFVKALQKLSPLIAEATITREGDESDDREGYRFDGSQWYTRIYESFLVPVDQVAQAKERLREVAKKLRGEPRGSS